MEWMRRDPAGCRLGSDGETKKQLVKTVWVNAAVVSLTVVGMAGNYFEKFDQNGLNALAAWLIVSALMMLFYVLWSFYSVFYQFRMTERDVRKLI